MKLFEREEHEALAAHLIAEATAARGQVLLLEGAAATGRTALLRQVAGMAERAGLQVVSATCSPVERELDGSVLSQLLHSDPDAGELADHAVPGYHEFCRQILRRWRGQRDACARRLGNVWVRVRVVMQQRPPAQA